MGTIVHVRSCYHSSLDMRKIVHIWTSCRRLGILPSGLEVFRRPEHEEEGQHDDVDNVPVALPVTEVVGVKGVKQLFDDRDIDRVGPGLWIVFVREGIDKSSE